MQKYYFLIVVCLAFASCNKWLEVAPEDKITKDELFQTESGFMEALNGVYTACARRDLYGVELSVGFPEVLAHNYHLVAGDGWGYKQTALYNFQDVRFVDRSDRVWRQQYNAIANCNLILENVDKGTVAMQPVNKGLIKGEALALRAYLHFDLLRLYAPSYASNPNAKAIPYVTAFSNKATPRSTVTEALNKMVADLTQAKELLKAVDPILTAAYKVGYPGDTASKELSSRILFQQNRRHRLNYYAVCGTLARVYLYLDKKQEALANATEVIDANKFPWTKAADFIHADETLKDRILYPELLFCWYDDWYESTYFGMFEAGPAGLYLDGGAGDNLYEKGSVGGEDLRFKHWFTSITDNGITRHEIMKYKRDKETNKHPLVHPAIRLSEMYHIAAEASWDTDPAKALAFLNFARSKRGFITNIAANTKAGFMDELVKEIRKETYAEGQLFYLYKRLNRGILQETGAVTSPSDKIFVLPLPNDELEYGQR